MYGDKWEAALSENLAATKLRQESPDTLSLLCNIRVLWSVYMDKFFYILCDLIETYEKVVYAGSKLSGFTT